MGDILVSVIIPTSGRNEKLLACLDSVFRSTYKNLEVIVVNDDPLEDLNHILNHLPLKLIQHDRKLFAAYSRNHGARSAKGELLFFLDDDNLLDKDAIRLLAEKYNIMKKVGLLGPVMYEKDGSLWFYGCRISWLTSQLKSLPISALQKTDLIQTEAIPNAYMISKQLYDVLGGQNELFPIHGEDADLAIRLAKRGLPNFIYRKAKTTHDYGGLSSHLSEIRLYFKVRNEIILEYLYASTWKFILFLLLFLPVRMTYYFVYYIPHRLKRRQYYITYLNGLIAGQKAIHSLTRLK